VRIGPEAGFLFDKWLLVLKDTMRAAPNAAEGMGDFLPRMALMNTDGNGTCGAAPAAIVGSIGRR
jgi:hypothetical protein